MRIYKHNRLPALGWNAEREVVDELRRIERWTVDVQYEIAQRPPWAPFCPDSSGAIPYLDCESGQVQPSPMVYHPDYVITSGNPAVAVDATLAFPFDRLLAFANEAGTEWLGGIGNFSEAPDVLIFAATADPANWSNTATRRPIAMGGSHVAIEAGSSMALALPGILANDYGYDLQIGADGQSVLAVANPPPDGEWHDTSPSNLDNLDSFTWEVFPNTGANATDRLEVSLPAGTEAGTADVRAAVRVDETSGSRSGTCTLGFGINGATPLAEDAQTFTIPAGFIGVLNFTKDFTMASDLAADAVLTFWYSITEEQALFNLLTDASLADHTLDATISYGGGGGTPTVPNHNALTGLNVLASGHTADVLNYSNVSSGLAANTVQAAIDEVAATPATPDHNDLSNLNVKAGGHSADVISYDNSGSVLSGTDVQNAIDQLAVVTGGWGGYTVDEGSGDFFTLPASGVWLTIDPAPKLAMDGSSGFSIGSDGSLWLTDLAPIKRATVHASVYLDSGQATLSEAVKMRIIRLPNGGSEAPAGGVARTRWTATDAITDFFCNLDSSLVNGAIDGVFELRYCKYFVQLSQTGGSSVVVRLRNFEFWCEYL